MMCSPKSMSLNNIMRTWLVSEKKKKKKHAGCNIFSAAAITLSFCLIQALNLETFL